ncbi:helix-turn-helix transcriptional regulator [Neofamilia massiliensis]|uniref:helix-turn-helix transcriptional regulator n=1 Tax=Neofamilia massiliensis TaxID=1673724 RepID=UPI0006BB59C2|nr:helix-turn-helix transcriptional regulator [Neofamilia massiliensis]
MALENKLKDLRSKKGLNQQDLGALVGVSRQTISLIERGDYNPSITVCLKLSQVLEVTVEDIFTYVEEEANGK